jgi:two-component system, response regulator PdtaR
VPSPTEAHTLPAVLCAAGAGSGPDDDKLDNSTHRLSAEPRQTVLIVEDEALVAMNIEFALEEAGYRVLGKADTELAAVEAANRLRPDIILMDITLRSGNGISAVREIQKSLTARIIFISGNSDPRTLAAAEELLPAGFIRKPFVTERLAALVYDAIKKR